MALHYEIDNTDLQILNLLMENAFTPYTEVGKKLFISPGTVHVRMNKMEKLGIVKNPQLQIDLSKLGMDITAFIGVYLIRSEMYDRVVTQLKKIDEVLSCNYTTGSARWLLGKSIWCIAFNAVADARIDQQRPCVSTRATFRWQRWIEYGYSARPILGAVYLPS